MANIEAGAFLRRNFVTSGFEMLTISGTVGGIALTGAEYGTARFALITVETAEIRFTTDGTSPTSTIGHAVAVGSSIILESNEDIVAFRAIRTTGVSGVIQTTYQDIKITA